jgi:selT/selW/selH-like putative selenoprotein
VNEVLGHWAPLFEGAELRTGSHGVFRVELDGDPVFDKAKAKRFPKPGEVADALRPRLGEPPDWR